MMLTTKPLFRFLARIRANLRVENTWRVVLALVGGFAVAITLTAAMAFVLVAEGVTNKGDAFYWASYVGFLCYFLAMIWAFASNKLITVLRVFSAVILACGISVWAQGGDASFGYGPGMSRFILLMGILVTLWTGFAALALSQTKHWQAVTLAGPCPPQTSRMLKLIGWVMLAASLILTLMRDGVSFGLLLWPTIAFAVALSVSLSIAYRPILLRRFAGEVAYFTSDPTKMDTGADAA